MADALAWDRDAATWPNSLHSRFVEAADIRWHLQRAGTGPGLLLVHGTGSSTHTWRDWLPELTSRFDVLAVDLPGHAFTTTSEVSHSSLQGMSRALGQLLQVERFVPQICIGHSAGAAILCEMILRNHLVPPRALVSLNGALLPFAGAASMIFAPAAKLLASLPFISRGVAFLGQDAATVKRMIAGTGSTLDAQGIALYGRLARDPKHVAGTLAMMAHWSLEGMDRQLGTLPVPLTLVTNAQDPMVPPSQARRIKARIPSARLIEVPQLGHLAHEEEPRQMMQVLAPLLG